MGVAPELDHELLVWSLSRAESRSAGMRGT